MIQEIFLPEIKTEKEEKNKTTFIIEPLNPGYGYTLGNALRRTLLSSLEGAAITSVKIKGASHEFTTLPGVKEDVIQIILNLKSLRIKVDSKSSAVITLKEKGRKEILGKHFKTPSGVEIINKDQYIASLERKDSELEIEANVEWGRGYISGETQEEKKVPIGVILLDAIFSPIVKVSWRVENTRVGKITNLDKLIIEIETDGTITSREALMKAGEILKEQFSLFTEETLKKKEKSKNKERKEPANISVEELAFSTRTLNALLAAKIKDTKALSKFSEEKLKKLKGLGQGGILEIKKKLKKLGLSLKE